MARKPLIKSPDHPYHLTARVNNRVHFPNSLDTTWRILTSELLIQHVLHGIEVQAFVLMPNHFHLILTSPELDIGTIMRDFLSSATRIFNLKSGRTGRLFGARYHWTLIESTRYFGHAYKYVYRNPVKAGLCEQVEDYPYSTLHGLTGKSHLPIPLFHTRLGHDLGLPTFDPVEQLKWLNQPFPKDAEPLIQLGLRKSQLSLLRDRKTRRPHPLLENLL